MVNLVNKILQKLDVFKIHPSLNFRDGKDISTPVSKFISILCYVLIITFFTFEVSSALNNRQYQIKDYKKANFGNKTLKINKNKILIALNFTVDPSMISNY
jgi:hypothetical protein